jgi:RNA polymerase sigma-70 factor (ECF subfamily)
VASGPPEEEEWIRRIREGDAGAFETLVRAYGPRLAEFASGFVQAQDEAEDVVQEVLWRVWVGRARWRPTVSLRAYLFTAVRNRVLNLLEHRRVRAHYYRDVLATGAEPAAPSVAENLEAAQEGAARQRALQDGFAGLTEKQQTAIRLRYGEGLAMAEVAATLGVSVSAAERLVARALGALREKLRGDGRLER